jgi:hypothetical protein
MQKAISFRFEVNISFTEVVALAIEGQYVAIASVHHRLMASRAEINDAEPIVPIDEVALPVRVLRSHHRLKCRLMRASSRVYQPAAYRTHSVEQPFDLRRSPLAPESFPSSGAVHLLHRETDASSAV